MGDLADSLTALGVAASPHDAACTTADAATTPAHVTCAAAIVDTAASIGPDLQAGAHAPRLLRVLLQLHMDPAMRAWAPTCMRAVEGLVEALDDAAWTSTFPV